MQNMGSAVILAGGQSTRMGFDKQLLKMDGQLIIRHLIAGLNGYFDDLMVASPNPELYQQEKVRVIGDIFQDAGPLGGIHTALVHAENEEVFVVACDMPFLEIPYIKYMRSLLVKENCGACVTQRGRHIETLHAFYCRSALPILQSELAAGNYSVHRFLEKIDTLIIPEEDAAPYLPDWLAFTNLNTPEDYEAFHRIIRSGPLRGEK